MRSWPIRWCTGHFLLILLAEILCILSYQSDLLTILYFTKVLLICTFFPDKKYFLHSLLVVLDGSRPLLWLLLLNLSENHLNLVSIYASLLSIIVPVLKFLLRIMLAQVLSILDLFARKELIALNPLSYKMTMEELLMNY